MYNNPSTPPAPAYDHWTRHPWHPYDTCHSQSMQPWQGHSSGQWSQATPELESQINHIHQQRMNFEINKKHQMQQLWHQ